MRKSSPTAGSARRSLSGRRSSPRCRSSGRPLAPRDGRALYSGVSQEDCLTPCSSCNLVDMIDNEDAEYHQAAIDFITALRGGRPANCDFCEQPFTAERWAIPEEAGEWACSECYARWRAEGKMP